MADAFLERERATALYLGDTAPVTSAPRSLSAIAREIRRTWKPVYFGAEPYLSAMASLDKVSDNYGYDSGESIVLYFLSNARNWRGEDAKRIKAELKALLPKARR